MTGTEVSGTGRPAARLADVGYPAERVSLVDLLDRVLAGGVVVTGEITLSIADVDLVVISLRALLTSVSALVDPAAEGER
jgi:Gas vesicle protein